MKQKKTEKGRNEGILIIGVRGTTEEKIEDNFKTFHSRATFSVAHKNLKNLHNDGYENSRRSNLS